jgi:hypothetical protein
VAKYPVAEKPEQYNNSIYNNTAYDNTTCSNTTYSGYSSIHQSYIDGIDDEGGNEIYRDIIASNIQLSVLLKQAESGGFYEVEIIKEIYTVICNMVCYPRDTVKIKGVEYPWGVVKSQYLKLRHGHIVDTLKNIVDCKFKIKNMEGYLISSLYTASVVGTLKSEAEIADDYVKLFRQNLYADDYSGAT